MRHIVWRSVKDSQVKLRMYTQSLLRSNWFKPSSLIGPLPPSCRDRSYKDCIKPFVVFIVFIMTHKGIIWFNYFWEYSAIVTITIFSMQLLIFLLDTTTATTFNTTITISYTIITTNTTITIILLLLQPTTTIYYYYTNYLMTESVPIIHHPFCKPISAYLFSKSTFFFQFESVTFCSILTLN